MAPTRMLYQRLPKLHRTRVQSTGYYYPFVRILRDAAIIVLDTVSGMGNIALHSGELGYEQIASLKKILGWKKVRDRQIILLMHHPPIAPKHGVASGDLRDANLFWHVVDRHRVDAIVCGHYHKNWTDEMHGVPVHRVGGLLTGEDSCLVLEINGNGIEEDWWQVWT